MLRHRPASLADADLLFSWVNDKVVRENSYKSETISYTEHLDWLNQKLCSGNCWIYIFSDQENVAVGQVRIEKDSKEGQAITGIIVNAENRGKGYSTEMLRQATEDFLRRNPGYTILAFIMKKNESSYKSFIRAGYKHFKEDIVMGIQSFILSTS